MTRNVVFSDGNITSKIPDPVDFSQDSSTSKQHILILPIEIIVLIPRMAVKWSVEVRGFGQPCWNALGHGPRAPLSPPDACSLLLASGILFINQAAAVVFFLQPAQIPALFG